MIEEVQFGKLPIGMKFYHQAMTPSLSGTYVKTYGGDLSPSRGEGLRIEPRTHYQQLMGFWYTDMVWIYRA